MVTFRGEVTDEELRNVAINIRRLRPNMEIDALLVCFRYVLQPPCSPYLVIILHNNRYIIATYR